MCLLNTYLGHRLGLLFRLSLLDLGDAGAQAFDGRNERIGHLPAVGGLALGLRLGGVLEQGGVQWLGTELRAQVGGGAGELEAQILHAGAHRGELADICLALPDHLLLELLAQRGELALETGTQPGGHVHQLAYDRREPRVALAQLGELGAELANVALGLLQTAAQLLDLGAHLALQTLAALLGLYAQLLLGVLALLDAADVGFAFGELLSDPLALAPDLLDALLERGEVGLEVARDRLGGLGSADHGGVGMASATLGQHVCCCVQL